MHTGMWQGSKLRMSRAGWARKMNKSSTLVIALLKEAAEAGIEQKQRMQFAIDNRNREPKPKRDGYSMEDCRARTREKRRRRLYGEVITYFLHKLPPPRQLNEIEG